MKIIWGIDIPYQSQEIDYEATDDKRKELEVACLQTSLFNVK